MKKTIEVVAKKVNDAIEEGLRQLSATLDDVEVKVIDQGGFFKKAKVELTIELPDPKPEKTEKTERESKAEKPAVKTEKPVSAPKKEERDERP